MILVFWGVFLGEGVGGGREGFLQNRVSLSFYPSGYLVAFLELYHCIITFRNARKTPINLCVIGLDFPEKKNYLQNWESEPKIGHKQGFLILLKKIFSDFYWIYSSIKTYFTCCVPSRIPYLGKILFLRYRPQNVLSQSDYMVF